MDSEVVSRVHRLLLDHIPLSNKKTPKGWISFSCPLCGDRRKRGGINTSGAKISYHCFNCPADSATTGWAPGYSLSKKFKTLALALGADDNEIYRVQLLLLEFNEFAEDDDEYVPTISVFRTKQLPDCVLVDDLPDDHSIKQYAITRDIIGLYPCLYFPDELYYEDRLVIPCYYNNNIVGWTGRHINPPNKQTPKYLSDIPSGYLFNIDKYITDDRDIIIVCEGFIDAIQVDGVAVMSNTITPEQALQIERLGKRVILCPDRNKAGHELIKQAMMLGWEVSFPPWDDFIIDAADACSKYGRLATVSSIIKYAVKNNTKIEVMMRMMVVE